MERKYNYRIEMAVPLGTRHGSLYLDVIDHLVVGQLTLFAHTMPIDAGSCYGGTVEFRGCMKTLMYTMKYTASGKINRSHAELDFTTEKGSFHAVGDADTPYFSKEKSNL